MNTSGKAVKAGSFQSMGLEANLLKGLNRIGYQVPTPVQRKALPIALAGLDIVCMSRTGSGKTCVFVLPLIQKLKTHNSSGVRAIILSPTRELAVQTFKVTKDMAKFTNLKVAAIIGGDSIDGQFDQLAGNPDIIVATPGRLMHHLREISTFKLKTVNYLVFDEADRIFEMGFAEQLNEIVRECPVERQTLLFSATMPKQLIQFSRAGLREPQFVRLESEASISGDLRLAFFNTRSNEKIAGLLYLMRRIIPKDHFSIIFTATKHHSELLHSLIQKVGFSSTIVYGSMDQDSRTLNLRKFKNGEVNYLIVTDVAARGIDIPLVNNVINFHFPNSPKLFIHRCGRAARQGRIGFAFNLIENEELPYVVDTYNFLNINISESATFDKELNYNLETMTPKTVHLGLLPQDILDEENEYFRQALNDDYQLLKLFQISENGLIQYKKTRPEATREGVKTTKSLLKNSLVSTIHPLINGLDSVNCNKLIYEKQNYIKTLQTFRPNQTVLESGIGTGASIGKNISNNNPNSKETHGFEIMKAFRSVTKNSLERNKIKINHEEIEEEVHDDNEEEVHDDNEGEDEEKDNDDEDENENKKQRLSVAVRRKLKKLGSTKEMLAFLNKQKNNKLMMASTSTSSVGSDNLENKFKDEKYFMTYGTEDQHHEFVENSLQPQSGLRGSEAMNAAMMENAMMDITPESAMDINKKKKMLRWDAKKRKFVKQTLEEMASSKKIRSEAGTMIKNTKKQGEMYEKWKKKRKMEISSSPSSGHDNDDRRPNPNFRHNTKVKSELKGVNEIKKSKEKKGQNKLKNMKKSKRDSIMSSKKRSRV